MPEIESSQPYTSATGCLLRIIWMVGGPAATFLTAAMIATSRGPSLGYRDLVYIVLLGATLGVRYLDVVAYHGTDSNNNTITRGAMWRWIGVTAAIGVALWFAAHGLAMFFAR